MCTCCPIDIRIIAFIFYSNIDWFKSGFTIKYYRKSSHVFKQVLRFQLPINGGKKLTRLFLRSAVMQDVVDFLVVHFAEHYDGIERSGGNEKEREGRHLLSEGFFRISAHFPARVLSDMRQTVEGAGLAPNGTLFVQLQQHL